MDITDPRDFPATLKQIGAFRYVEPREGQTPYMFVTGDISTAVSGRSDFFRRAFLEEIGGYYFYRIDHKQAPNYSILTLPLIVRFLNAYRNSKNNNLIRRTNAQFMHGILCALDRDPGAIQELKYLKCDDKGIIVRSTEDNAIDLPFVGQPGVVLFMNAARRVEQTDKKAIWNRIAEPADAPLLPSLASVIEQNDTSTNNTSMMDAGLRLFMAECCILDIASCEKVEVLYAAYRQWCCNRPYMPYPAFVRHLPKLFVLHRVLEKSVALFRGCRLKAAPVPIAPRPPPIALDTRPATPPVAPMPDYTNIPAKYRSRGLIWLDTKEQRNRLIAESYRLQCVDCMGTISGVSSDVIAEMPFLAFAPHVSTICPFYSCSFCKALVPHQATPQTHADTQRDLEERLRKRRRT